MELIGFNQTLGQLVSLAKERRLSHALIFTGIEGIGKKRLALELARFLLERESLEQLDHYPDFLYLEEKNTIGVEEIKKVLQFVVERPLFGKRKVLLINDAHKMNSQAQNKILKTLEEPPDFLTFLLVSSAPGRLLDTIRSRVVEYPLKPHSEEAIYQALEGYKEEERHLAARFSGGSFQRAFAIVEDEELRKLFFFPEKIFDALQEGNRLKLLDYAKEYGKDKEMASLLMEHCMLWLRDLALVGENRSTQNLYYQDRLNVLIRHSQSLGRNKIPHFRQELEKGQKRLAANCNPEILLWNCLMQLQEGMNQ
ncbi:MAG: hypothetical protein GX046_06355 [Tissierellia bacterium]|nr:hypothetical protein [Tissierellia bacterium]